MTSHGHDHDHNHDDDDFMDEPPPSYEEAVGSTPISYSQSQAQNHSQDQQQQPQPQQRPVPQAPPPLPPRQPSISRKPLNTPTNPFTGAGSTRPQRSPSSSNAGGASSSAAGPPQTFAQLLPRAAHHTVVTRQFPPIVNLYREAFPGALQQRCFLAEHQPSPLYAVGAYAASTPGGLAGLAGLGGLAGGSIGNPAATPAYLVLHNGPTDDHPPLATAAYDPSGRRSVDVNLPPLPDRGASPPITVALPARMSKTMGFRVEVPWPGRPGGDGATVWRNEAYEWRPSTGGVVGGLGGSSRGWKLVRLSNELPPGATGGGTGPPSGDGFEVVAVCTTAVMSMTKLWKFCFLGTGVSGALGERWAVMAVVTGLVIWDWENRRF